MIMKSMVFNLLHLHMVGNKPLKFSFAVAGNLCSQEAADKEQEGATPDGKPAANQNLSAHSLIKKLVRQRALRSDTV